MSCIDGIFYLYLSNKMKKPHNKRQVNMQVISSKILKARKEHKCDLCLEKIEKGTQYERQCNKIDDVYTFKSHLYCRDIASRLKMYDECDYGLNDENFMETIREQFIFLQELHNSEVFNYEHYQYPSFQEQLYYVCDFHKITVF